MLGINGGEFVLLLVVALVVVGPERLPRYAEQLGVWVRTARRYALSAKERVTEELGEDVADVDWAALDPRRYDPRRIVREALLDDTDPPLASAVTRGDGAAARGAEAHARTAAAAGVAAAGAAGATPGTEGTPGASSPAVVPTGGPDLLGGLPGHGSPHAAATTSPAAPYDDEAT